MERYLAISDVTHLKWQKDSILLIESKENDKLDLSPFSDPATKCFNCSSLATVENIGNANKR